MGPYNLGRDVAKVFLQLHEELRHNSPGCPIFLSFWQPLAELVVQLLRSQPAGATACHCLTSLFLGRFGMPMKERDSLLPHPPFPVFPTEASTDTKHTTYQGSTDSRVLLPSFTPTLPTINPPGLLL